MLETFNEEGEPVTLRGLDALETEDLQAGMTTLADAMLVHRRHGESREAEQLGRVVTALAEEVIDRR